VRVYIAAPKAELARAKSVASQLRERGIEVTSRWHEVLAEGAKDPTDREERGTVLRHNLADLGRATVMLALTSDGAGRETYVEIGRAIECGIPVVWSIERGGEALSSSSAFVAATDADAIACLALVASGAP